MNTKQKTEREAAWESHRNRDRTFAESGKERFESGFDAGWEACSAQQSEEVSAVRRDIFKELRKRINGLVMDRKYVFDILDKLEQETKSDVKK